MAQTRKFLPMTTSILTSVVSRVSLERRLALAQTVLIQLRYDLIRATLRKKAFHPGGGPLADKSQVAAEREADVYLLSAGLGRAR